jgi:hypothetical protein
MLDEQYRNGKDNTDNLYFAIHREIERVKEIIPHYEAMGKTGEIALHFIRNDLSYAEEVLKGSDIVELCQCLVTLKAIKD